MSHRQWSGKEKFQIVMSGLKSWMVYYNEDYPHSALGYMTPYEYERWFNASVHAA